MAIEVDYFAWEKWRTTNHQLSEEYASTWSQYTPQLFLRADSAWRVLEGDVYFHLYYGYVFGGRVFQDHLHYSYELIRENGKISKLLKITHDIDADGYYSLAQAAILEDWHLYFEFVDVDALSAAKLEEIIDLIPSFSTRNLLVDISWGTMPRVWDAFQLRLNNEKHHGQVHEWQLSTQPLSMMLYSDEMADSIEQSLKHIMLICDALTGQMEKHKPQLRQIVQKLKETFTQNKLYIIPNYYHKPFSSEIKNCEDWSLASWHPENYHPKEMGDYASKAISECGSREDFKRFLPRLLRMLIESKEALEGEEAYGTNLLRMILQKLNLANWKTWDKQEQELIEAYLETAWAYLLAYYPSVWLSIDDFLFALLANQHELNHYLSTWDTSSEFALRHAAALIRKRFDVRKIPSKELLKTSDELWDWVMRDSLYESLNQTYENTEGKRPYAHEFAEALEALELIRAYH